MVLPADARYPITHSNTCNKLLSPLAIALAREALERANAGLDVAGSADGGLPEFVLSRHECKSRTEPPSCLDESSLRAYADLSPTRKLPSRENDAVSRI